MAYETDVVNDLAELLAFIRTACTSHGWTLSTNVLHKGTCYVSVTESSGRIAVRGGTGIDGSDNLTGAGPYTVYIGHIASQALTFPMTVEAHINASPDEVYIVCNYATSFYQFAAWGLSDVPGLTGSGVWYYATRNGYTFGNLNFASGPDGGTVQATIPPSAGGSPLFWANAVANNDGLNTSYIHADVDSGGWHGAGTSRIAHAFAPLVPLLSLLPNNWNGETILLPYSVYVARSAGSKVSLVADLKNIRLARITYHEPGDLITLGTDEWKLYPCYQKNASTPNGDSSGTTHSGTVGYAIRYTGP